VTSTVVPPLPAPRAAVADPAVQRFMALVRAVAADTGAPAWQRVLLAKPVASPAEPRDASATAPWLGALRVSVRPLSLRGELHLSFVYSHATQDITKNLALESALAHLSDLLGPVFRNAHLFDAAQEVQLSLSKKGKGHLSLHPRAQPTQASAGAAGVPAASPTSPVSPTHDRPKERWLALDRPFLCALGVTTAQHQLVPAMARKWKQINKFLEVFAHALEKAALLPAAGAAPAAAGALAAAPLRVVDFGAGKAYLTFAVHDWLCHTRGLAAEVTGVELRADLVQQGNQAVADLGLQGLQLVQGDVRSHATPAMDVMIALHACDTATDDAIHLGLRAGARVIVCSPCCHKELRPQLLSPHPLRSVFQHGIHAEQTAEMVTDSLRALLLQSQGYDTQVFEFVALEHTRKNKMILAVKRAATDKTFTPAAQQAVWTQIEELSGFFGVRDQRLRSLLQ
jgi:hypothetical protein